MESEFFITIIYIKFLSVSHHVVENLCLAICTQRVMCSVVMLVLFIDIKIFIDPC